MSFDPKMIHQIETLVDLEDIELHFRTGIVLADDVNAWIYTTDDPLSEVATDGYLDADRSMLRPGDLLITTTSAPKEPVTHFLTLGRNEYNDLYVTATIPVDDHIGVVSSNGQHPTLQLWYRV